MENKQTRFPSVIENTLNRIAPKQNIDTSTKQQWSHLDIGTATFVMCIIAFSICFSYLIPASYNSPEVYNIQFIALIVALCFTFIFPLSWVSSTIEYPDRNTKYYILVCLFVGIILEFVSLLMTMFTNNSAQTQAKEYNANLNPEDIESKKMVVVTPSIIVNNQYIYKLFTTTIVLMIGCVATFFYDEVTIEKEMIASGVNVKPVSTMGTNIHWWLTFVYEKANDFDNWWHQVMDMIPIASALKMFILFVIGFLIMFFIFVDLRILSSPPSERKMNKSDYKLDKNGNPLTSFPNTTSPLMQNGVFILYGEDNIAESAPIRKPILNVRYLPNTFTPEAYSNINLFALLMFFLSFLICILIIPTLYGIHSILQHFLNLNTLSILFTPIPVSVILIVTFLLSFLLLYFYCPPSSNMIILYILITFVFALLSGPVVLLLIELFTLTFFQSSLSVTGIGWYLFVGLIIAIWIVTFSLNTEIFNIGNMVNRDSSANILQLFTVLFIAMTVGWFFGLSFHFDMFTFLFVLVFTPIKYVLKVFGPIAVLALTVTQIILASESSNKIGKTTAG